MEGSGCRGGVGFVRAHLSQLSHRSTFGAVNEAPDGFVFHFTEEHLLFIALISTSAEKVLRVAFLHGPSVPL